MTLLCVWFSAPCVFACTITLSHTRFVGMQSLPTLPLCCPETSVFHTVLSALKAADAAMAAADDARGNHVLLRDSSGDLQGTPMPPTPALGPDAPHNPFLVQAPSLTLQDGRNLLSSSRDEVCCTQFLFTTFGHFLRIFLQFAPTGTSPCTPLPHTTLLQHEPLGDEVGMLGSMLHGLVGDDRRYPTSPGSSTMVTPSPGASPAAVPGAHLQGWRRSRSIGSAASFSSVPESPETAVPPITPDWVVGGRPGLYRSVSDIPAGVHQSSNSSLPFDLLSQLGKRPSAASSGFASKAVALLLAFDSAQGGAAVPPFFFLRWLRSQWWCSVAGNMMSITHTYVHRI